MLYRSPSKVPRAKEAQKGWTCIQLRQPGYIHYRAAVHRSDNKWRLHCFNWRHIITSNAAMASCRENPSMSNIWSSCISGAEINVNLALTGEDSPAAASSKTLLTSSKPKWAPGRSARGTIVSMDGSSRLLCQWLCLECSFALSSIIPAIIPVASGAVQSTSNAQSCLEYSPLVYHMWVEM